MSMLPLDPAPERTPEPARRPAAAPRTPRREPRDPSVRLVECAPFPRASSDQSDCSGITRDVSRSGLGLRLGRGLPAGSLVRVRVRSLEGHLTLDSLARVAWCRAEGEASAALGLSLLTDSGPVPRRTEPPRSRTAPVAVCA